MTELRQRQPRIECPAFLAFVRTRPCCACGITGRSQAAHIRTGDAAYGKRDTGAREKPSDMWAVPLCGPDLGRSLPGCHAEQHSMNEMEFWTRYRLDPFAVAAQLWARYTAEHPQAAANALSKSKVRKHRPGQKRAKSARRPARNAKIASRPNSWPAKGTRKIPSRRKPT